MRLDAWSQLNIFGIYAALFRMETKTSNNIINQIRTNGFVYLTSQGKNDLEVILKNLGEIIGETDVRIRPDSKALVTSTRELDFHTDHHKAKYIVWYCHIQTSKGGESILMDAEKIWMKLTGEEQEQLANIRLFEHKVFPDDKENYPFVNIDKNGHRKFYYSLWLVNEKDRSNTALRRFQELMRQAEPIRLTLNPSDILIVDNHRVLHGRTAIEGTKDRFLKRYWITSNN